MVSKIWLSDNLRVSKTYFLEVRGVLEHPEHPSGNATGKYSTFEYSVYAVYYKYKNYVICTQCVRIIIILCRTMCKLRQTYPERFRYNGKHTK